jgi:mRNA interferase MazF
MTTESQIRRGDIFGGKLDPVVGHEQAGRRPVLVVSINPMNGSAAELVIAVPLTTRNRGNELHVRLDPPEGGLDRVSYVLPEMIRVLSTNRLGRRLGRASPGTVEVVAKRVGILVGLGRTR